MHDYFHPPIPLRRHRYARALVATQVRLIFEACMDQAMDDWIVKLHRAIHANPNHPEGHLHDQLFLVGSEYYGNPLLFAAENLFVRQAAYFLDSIPVERIAWDHWIIRHAVRTLTNFRIRGPDEAVIIAQRLAGHYGPPVEIFAPNEVAHHPAPIPTLYTPLTPSSTNGNSNSE